MTDELVATVGGSDAFCSQAHDAIGLATNFQLNIVLKTHHTFAESLSSLPQAEQTPQLVARSRLLQSRTCIVAAMSILTNDFTKGEEVAARATPSVREYAFVSSLVLVSAPRPLVVKKRVKLHIRYSCSKVPRSLLLSAPSKMI